MCPASGPVTNPKMFPAAVHDDQEKLMEGNVEPITLSTPPFSSPNSATDAKKMLPLEDGTSSSALDARVQAKQAKEGEDYDSKSPAELKALAEERDLEVKGTGANGNVKKADLVAALKEDDSSDMKASDFKDRITAATNQEELDSAAEMYAASGKKYKTVESAVKAKQDELNSAGEDDDQ